MKGWEPLSPAALRHGDRSWALCFLGLAHVAGYSMFSGNRSWDTVCFPEIGHLG